MKGLIGESFHPFQRSHTSPGTGCQTRLCLGQTGIERLKQLSDMCKAKGETWTCQRNEKRVSGVIVVTKTTKTCTDVEPAESR